MNKLLLICTSMFLLASQGLYGQVTVYPYSEDFETEIQGPTGCGGLYTMQAAGWTNLSTDDIDWSSDVGGTTSSSTGPSVDHNPGTATGHYLYTESSTCYGQLAELTSPMFDLTGVTAGMQLDFWYHMYGQSMGTLTLSVSTDGGTSWTPEATFTDNVDLWQQATINLTGYVGNVIQLKFSGLTGSDFYSDMAIDDISMTEYSNPDDVGVLSIDNPVSPYTPGALFTQVTLQNYGTNAVNSMTVNWTVDGVLQSPLNYATPLGAGQSVSGITLGVYNYPIGSVDICVWTTIPNGNADNDTSNDSLCTFLCTGLAGTYTVGGGTPDFATLTDAVSALTTCGISAPVIFDVAPGTYNEAISIPPVLGASATNTITFDGGSATTTTIEHDAVGQTSVIELDGGDFITFKNFTIKNTGTTDAWGVFLTDTAEYDSILNCNIEMEVISAMIDVAGIMASGDALNDATQGYAANYCVFDNNIITGGERGISFYGSSNLAGYMTGNKFTNNQVYNSDDYGIYAYYQDSLTVSGNVIDSIQQTVNGDGLWLYYVSNFTIEENNVHAPDYGMYLYYGNYSITATNPCNVVNNMIRSEADYGLYTYYTSLVNFWHNTIANNSGTSPAFYASTNTANWNMRNNIFYSETDEAFYSTTNLLTNNNTVDYNDYWTNGATFIYDAGAQADLASWQTAQPTLNMNSVEMDPVFVSSTDNHVLSINLDDLGDNSVGITTDIDGDTRPMGVNVDMGADEYTPLTNDAVLVTLLSPGASQCGSNAFEVKVVISNYADTIFTLPIEVNITGDIVQTLNTTYNDTLLFNQTDTVVVGTIDTYTGGSIVLTAYTQYPGDQNTDNDTIYNVAAMFTPFEPAGFSDPSCGYDFVTLFADSTYTSQFEWFDAPTGGSSVGLGTSYTIPSILTQDTYYLEYQQVGLDSIETTYAAGNSCGGGSMFDVTSTSGTLITGFRMGSTVASGSPLPVTVHYIVGTHIGNETNAGAWTTEGSYTITSAGTGAASSLLTLNTPITCPAGQTIGIYLEYAASYTTGSVSTDYLNVGGDITVTAGTGLCSSFGGTNFHRLFNGTVYFGTNPCSDIRVPVQANQTPQAAVNLGEDTVACAANGAVILDPGSGLTNFMWSPSGNTGATESVTSNGQYLVTATDVNNCTWTDTVLIIFGECLGVEEYDGISNMNLYPNPSNGQFDLMINLEAGVSVLAIDIISVDGKLVYSEQINQSTSVNKSFDMSHQERGIYLIKVLTSEGTAIRKMILE